MGADPALEVYCFVNPLVTSLGIIVRFKVQKFNILPT
jgi:hypothetical protein